MTTADEHTTRRHTTGQPTAWNRPTLRHNPVTPRTSPDKASRALTRQRYLDRRLSGGACAMTATDEGAMRRLIAERVAARNRSAPRTDPITLRTSTDKISPTLTHQRYLEGTYAVERER